ncbi:MAG: hypothetical protein ASARMPREDX12_002040 [Alectoria sarmentosa]|nr:MAG: hypothetical protein ASARMPREDX12_002040 [Alectoria sarmentosa]
MRRLRHPCLDVHISSELNRFRTEFTWAKIFQTRATTVKPGIIKTSLASTRVGMGQTKLLIDRGQGALRSSLIEAKEPHWDQIQGYKSTGQRLLLTHPDSAYGRAKMSSSKDQDSAIPHPGFKSLQHLNPRLGTMYFRFKEGEGLRYMAEEAFLAWKALPSSQSADNKPFFVFLHDYGSSSRIFDKLARSVKNHCLAVDLRGWGRSNHTKDGTPLAYSITRMKDDLPRVINLLQGEKFVLVGHGMGAKVAQLYATQQPPKNLMGLALLAPMPLSSRKPAPETIQIYRKAYETRENLEDFTKKYLAHSLIDEVDLRNLVDDGMKDTPLAKDAWLSYSMDENYSHGLRGIEMPVLIFAGEFDRMIPVGAVEKEVGNKIKGSWILPAKNCGHLIPLEEPGLAEILEDWSKDIESWKRE